MQLALLFLHIVIVLFLIAVVLLQRSEGGALGMGGGGGGGGGGLMSGRGAATALQKVTWGLGVAFVVSSVVLALYGRQAAEQGSVAEVAAIEEALPGGDADPAPALPTDALTPALPGAAEDSAESDAADAAPAAGDDVTPTLPE